jgi:predicted adenine nucleotide alpha hydrolase (AANH) superfamily ATPase
VNEKSLLIHACCAPCVSYVHGLFADTHDVTVYFYNPNIAPRPEYDRRLAELERFAAAKNFPLVAGGYDAREWTLRVKQYRFLGERSPRCRECIRIRLEESFRKARELGIAAVTTSLSVSPHKDACMINGIGKELEAAWGVRFIEGDFKKADGYRKSVALSRVYGFYRQNYCGCVYSKLERAGDSAWTRAAAQSSQRMLS